MIDFFKEFFFRLEHLGFLDADDNVDIYILYCALMKSFNYRIEKFKTHYNNHPLSTKGNNIPLYFCTARSLNIKLLIKKLSWHIERFKWLAKHWSQCSGYLPSNINVATYQLVHFQYILENYVADELKYTSIRNYYRQGWITWTTLIVFCLFISFYSDK